VTANSKSDTIMQQIVEGILATKVTGAVVRMSALKSDPKRS
jgi:hypothetical protein